MSNKSAGNRYFDAGLVIQSKPEIDTNEYGLMEATFSFLTAVSNWPTIQPARGTPCNTFDYGDSATSTFLSGVSFLGAQSCRWKPGRLSDLACPGTLEVHCQGAKFTETIARRVQTIAIVSGGSGYTGHRPDVIVTGGGEIRPAAISAPLEVSTRALNAAGTGYVVGDTLTVSGGVFHYPATLRVDSIGGGGAISTFHITNRGKYARAPSNPVSVTGGTGSGATFNLTWRVGFIIVSDGGLYTSTPNVAISFGNAILGEVRMSGGNDLGTGSLEITVPWKPVSTTKDTVQFTVYNTIETNPNASTQVKYATTSDLGPASYYTNADGRILLENTNPVKSHLSIDGVPVSTGDLLLIKDETSSYRNGIYTVIKTGDDFFAWKLARAAPYDEATGITTALTVLVQSGQDNVGTIWACATNVTTLAADDGTGGDSITFDSTSNDPSTTTTPTWRVTIDYHAIDLHFEYMANQKLRSPYFVQPVYTMDEDRFIVTDPVTSERQFLSIDSILLESITVDATTGNTQYTPVNLLNFDWWSFVRFEGTAARFEQTPAGQYYHILETSTIKIVPVGLSAN